MTPKEKAEELVEKYADVLPSVFYNSEEAKNYPRAKVCALISVDEIIEFMSPMVHSKQAYDYWDEVKQEIEKL
jgi:hypothetical protein